MKTGVKVGDLMTRNFIYVSPETNLKECSVVMAKKRVGSLIIKEGDKLRGILTEKDIIWAIVKKSPKDLVNILAKDLMKKKVVAIKPDADITEALERMKKKKVRRLPVLESGRVIGMITLNDIIKIDPGLFELIAENVKIKEETEKIARGSKIKGAKKDGTCEECGEFGLLFKDNGLWLCERCYNSK